VQTVTRETVINVLTSHLDVCLPLILILMAFLLKLSMDRGVTFPLFICSLFELPVDVLFVALTFLTGYTISDIKHRDIGLVSLFATLFFTYLAIILWRRSLNNFDGTNYFRAASLFVINGSMAAYILYHVVLLLTL
jgi:hypothetical protein